MRFIGRKTREEKDFERKVKLNEALIRLDRYISNSENLLREYEKQAVEAKRLGNEVLVKRFATKMLVLDRQIRKAKSLRLIIKDLELSREQSASIKDFADVVKDFSLALSADEITAKMVGEIKRNMEVAMAKARRMDIVLSEIVDSVTDTLLTAKGVEEEEIKDILEGIESKAAESERRMVRDIRAETQSG